MQCWFWFACVLAPSLLLLLILLSEKQKNQFQLASTQERSYAFEDVNTKHMAEVHKLRSGLHLVRFTGASE